MRGALNWDSVLEELLSSGSELCVSRDSIEDPLDAGFKRTRLGLPRLGSLAQYAKPLPEGKRIHVYEYPHEYCAHVDRCDPEDRPLCHLLLDSAGILLLIALGLWVILGYLS